jgi:hypothetical protein
VGAGKGVLPIEESKMLFHSLLIRFCSVIYPPDGAEEMRTESIAAFATATVMAESASQGGHPIRLAFSPTSVKESGNFRLLELPPDLLKSIESNNNFPLSWAIKGNPTEDAVLCTNDKTYSVRSVSLSNSVLVVSPGGGDDKVVIRNTNRELLQVAPILPKVHKLAGLLRGREYDEGREDLDDDLLDDRQDAQNQRQVCPTISFQ